MAKKIQHLRGKYNDYKENNITPWEGEIALEEGEDGYTRMKVGDGKTSYLDLPYLTGTVVSCFPDENGDLSLTLRHGYEYRAGALSSLTLNLPETLCEDYSCAVVFDCSMHEASVSYPKEIVFSGDDTSGGLFFPQKRTRYIITLKNRTGAIYACVVGISHDLAYQSYYEVATERLPSIAALEVKKADKILDVSVEGFLGHADTDGFMTGLGNYSWEKQQYLFRLIWQNGCLFDYQDLKRKVSTTGSYTLSLIDYRDEGDDFSYLANATASVPLATSTTHPFASGFQYRLCAKVSLIDSQTTFTPGETIAAPFKFYYGSETEIPTMTYTAEGAFMINFTTPKDKVITRILSTGVNKKGRILIHHEDFSIIAIKDGYEGENTKRQVAMTIATLEPLRGTKSVKDTLSLSTGQIVRRIEANIIGSFTLDNFDETYPVFKLPLPVEMDANEAGEMPYFEEANSLEELGWKPKHFYFDPLDGNGVLYFSGDDNIYSVSDMNTWIYENYDILGYAYPKATPTIEQVDMSSVLIPYEGYTFLLLEGHDNASFLATYYLEEEKEEM